MRVRRDAVVRRLRPWLAAASAVHRFAFTDAIGVVALELVLVMAVTGLIAGDYGSFDVTWRDSSDGFRWRGIQDPDKWAVLINGFALGLFFCTTAYLTYLLYGISQDRDIDSAERSSLYQGKALPMLLLALLPAFAPFLPGFNPNDEDVYGLLGHRMYGAFSAAVAVALFGGLVRLLTRYGGRIRTLPTRLGNLVGQRPQASVQSHLDIYRMQADGQFVVVLFAYAGLFGYTLVDDPERPALPTLFRLVPTLVTAGLVWRFASSRPSTTRWVGRIAVVGVAVVVAGLALLHWTATGGIGWWVLIPAAYLVWVVGLLLVRLRSNRPHAAAGVGYAAAAIGVAASGALAGWLTGGLFGSTDGFLIPAAASVALLLAAVASLYGVLRVYGGGLFYPLLLAVTGGLIMIGSIRPYPHHIQELEHLYRLTYRADAVNARPKLAAPPDPDGTTPLLDDVAVLRGWRGVALTRGIRRPQNETLVGGAAPSSRKPPLVIVTTAGGASTSAIFTFAMLTEIEKRLPGFRHNVRIMAGASGGMLGAAVYRVWCERIDAKELEVGRPLVQFETEAITKPLREGLERDYLSPIVQALAFKDVPMSAVCPSGYWDDRGRRLERAWEGAFNKALNVTLAELGEREAGGRYPSLIFSPMLVEDGRPLFVSTLDLGYLAVRNPDDPGRRVRGLEFRRLFPADGGNLRLGTAVRLNASFPYFSPAATLPTVPPRRVVDAGYYENYGMAVALGWLEQNQLVKNYVGQPELRDFASRVAILELRPYLGWTESALTGPERDNSGRVPQFASPLQELTTPLEGAEAARKTGMVNRNNDQRIFLDWALAKQSGDPESGYISTFVFKGDLRTSLNWTLPASQARKIRGTVDEIFGAGNANPNDARNRDTWNELRDFLAQ